MADRLFVGATNRIGMVPVESISVTEVGPGGVSSMSFTIEDPTEIITPSRLMDIVLDRGSGATRLFAGYATTITMRPLAVGRAIDIEATGVEALLDWLVNGTVLITGGRNFGDAIVDIITSKTANFITGTPSTRYGNATDRVGDFDMNDGTPPAEIPFLTDATNWTVPSGTLRWQIEELHRMSAFDIAGTKTGFGFLLTVDWGGGIRAWEDVAGDATAMPDDYDGMVVDSVPGFGGEVLPENFEHGLDYGAVPNRVRVVGTGVAAAFSGTNTFPGIEHVLNDPELTSVAERDNAGVNYLLQNATPERGTFRITDWDPLTTDIHAGSTVTLNMPQVDLSAVVARIMQIEKRFHSTGRQDWTVTYGRMGDNFSRAIKQGLAR